RRVAENYGFSVIPLPNVSAHVRPRRHRFDLQDVVTALVDPAAGEVKHYAASKTRGIDILVGGDAPLNVEDPALQFQLLVLWPTVLWVVPRSHVVDVDFLRLIRTLRRDRQSGERVRDGRRGDADRPVGH